MSKKTLYRLAIAFSCLLTLFFICACVGTFSADKIDWKIGKPSTNEVLESVDSSFKKRFALFN